MEVTIGMTSNREMTIFGQCFTKGIITMYSIHILDDVEIHDIQRNGLTGIFRLVKRMVHPLYLHGTRQLLPRGIRIPKTYPTKEPGDWNI